MVHVEQFLFFPIIVLVAIILIALSFRLILRLFLFFLIISALWFGLYALGFVPSPVQVLKSYQSQVHKKHPYA
jgi:disulfide bond formation protein DsbB